MFIIPCRIEAPTGTSKFCGWKLYSYWVNIGGKAALGAISVGNTQLEEALSL